MKAEAVYNNQKEPQQIQYSNQIQQLREMMMTPGWVVLMANWQKVKDEILENLEKTKTEGRWEFYRGQLLGFKQAIHTAKILKETAEQELEDQKQEEEENYVRT